MRVCRSACRSARLVVAGVARCARGARGSRQGPVVGMAILAHLAARGGVVVRHRARVLPALDFERGAARGCGQPVVPARGRSRLETREAVGRGRPTRAAAPSSAPGQEARVADAGVVPGGVPPLLRVVRADRLGRSRSGCPGFRARVDRVDGGATRGRRWCVYRELRVRRHPRPKPPDSWRAG